ASGVWVKHVVEWLMVYAVWHVPTGDRGVGWLETRQSTVAWRDPGVGWRKATLAARRGTDEPRIARQGDHPERRHPGAGDARALAATVREGRALVDAHGLAMGERKGSADRGSLRDDGEAAMARAPGGRTPLRGDRGQDARGARARRD